MAQQWLKGMMVVGSTDIKGDRHSVSDIPGTGPESAVDVWAPGKLLPLPEGWLKSDISIWTAGISGTSFGESYTPPIGPVFSWAPPSIYC